MERWLEINYCSKGRVRNVITGRVLSLGIDAQGYYNECAKIIGCNWRHIQDCLAGRLNQHHGFHFEEIKENCL